MSLLQSGRSSPHSTQNHSCQGHLCLHRAKSTGQFLVAILVQRHLTPSSSLPFTGLLHACQRLLSVSSSSPLIFLGSVNQSSHFSCLLALAFSSSLRTSSETMHKQLIQGNLPLALLHTHSAAYSPSLLGCLMGFAILMS